MTSSTTSPLPLVVHNLGLAPYATALEIQKKVHRTVVEQQTPFHLILCSHPPIITLGTSGTYDQLRVPVEVLQRRGIEVVKTGRGGKITYHGPEQLIGYPIFDLKLLKRDVSWFMRQLEEVLIRSIHLFGVTAVQDPGRTGVWIPNTVKTPSEPSKIASIGVKLSRWCSYHGFAVNLLPCSEMFSLIDPCGYPELPITSLSEECGKSLEMSLFSQELVSQFEKVFDLTVVSTINEQEPC
jgi:lipoyl(octanoyl) transferase